MTEHCLAIVLIMKFYLLIFTLSFYLLTLHTNSVKAKFSFKQTKSSIAHAFILGDKSAITRTQKNDLQRLGALHLLTPSGLHLSSFIAMLSLILTVLNKEKWKIPTLVVFGTLLLTIPEFYSLKRTLFFYLLGYSLYSFKNLKNKSILIFCIVFTLDFLFGSFKYSPLSFTFSFLFLGTIIAFKDANKWQFFGSLFLNQILVSYFFTQKFYLLGPLFGFILTSIFGIVFPIGLISFPFDMFTDFRPSSFFFSLFLNLTHWFSLLAQEGPMVMIGLCIIVCMLIGFSTQRLRWVLPILLTVEAQPLFNLPLSAFKKAPTHSNYKLTPEPEVLKVDKVRRGFRSWHPHQIKCNVTLYSYFWEKKCVLHNKTM